MTDAPERIYLQWIPEGNPAADEITWCIHEINDEDIKYTRTDIAEKDDVIEHLRIALNDCDVEITAKDTRIAELEAELNNIKNWLQEISYVPDPPPVEE